MLTIDEAIKILDKIACNCNEGKSGICESHMKLIIELLKRQSESVKKLISIQPVYLHKEGKILILRAFDNGDVYIETLSIFDKQEWTSFPSKLQPIRQEGEKC